jgi:hypothetical protein
MNENTTEMTLQNFYDQIDNGFRTAIDRTLDDQSSLADAPSRDEIVEALAHAHEGLEQEPGYDAPPDRIVSQSDEHIVIEIANTRELLLNMEEEPRQDVVDAVMRVFGHTAKADARLETSETYPIGILLRQLDC